jgi:two-component system, cell cycle sensor histidine kinase and response regulator CckA
LLDTVKLTEDERNALLDIIDSAKRGATLVRQLSLLRRSPLPHLDLVDVSAVARETVSLLSDTMQKKHVLSIDCTKEELMVKGTSDQIRQVIINLCLNSRDAMPAGGKIDIRVSRLHKGASESTGTPDSTKEFAMVSVADTGEGIPASLQARIFDAFFTTRGLANRSGLGLTVAAAIIRDHGGVIKIDSDPGGGTTARILIPLSSGRASDDTGEQTRRKRYRSLHPEDMNSLPAHTENGRALATILVVDDEEAQLRTASRILQHAGYEVIASQSLESAYDALNPARTTHKHAAGTPHRIDLIILDLVFPGHSMEDLLPHFKSISGRVPIIIVSGTTDRQGATKLFNMGASTIISKPYEKKHLLRAIAIALNEGRQNSDIPEG